MADAASSSAVEMERDSAHMQRALALAQRGWGQTAPNPMVGAVVVANGVVVGEGWHARYGEAHAEVVALRRASDQARGATLYVTLEPCAHHGKTPPCIDAILAAGIARVVVAIGDPSVTARGGASRLRSMGVDVEIGTERSAALELNAPFFNATCATRPWVTLKLALSADGGIAHPTGEQRWITGAESRREVHRARAHADAIAVGVGTVIADDPSLTVRDVPQPRVTPRRVVFDSNLRTPTTSTVVRTARETETIFVARSSVLSGVDRAPFLARAAELTQLGATVLETTSTRGALEVLRQREIRSLYVEGGARFAGALLTEDLVDRLVIFRAPTSLGEGAVKAFAYAPQDFEKALEQYRVIDERRFGDDVMTTYALHEVPCSPG